MEEYDYELLKEKLYNNLSNNHSEVEKKEIEKRYKHIIGVVETAERLAEIYGENIEKAKIAALLHDCAKFYTYGTFKEKYNITLDEEVLKYPNIVHCFIGQHVARQEYGIKDEDILNAIKYHTTGRPNMTTLEKIIYLADATEPNRKVYHGLSKARRLTEKNLDEAMRFVLDLTMQHVRVRNLELFRLTKEAYNYYKA